MKLMLRSILALGIVFAAAPLAAQPMADGLHLRPLSAVTKPGGSVKLELVHCLRVIVGKAGETLKGSTRGATGTERFEDPLAPLPSDRLECDGEERSGDTLGGFIVQKDVKWQVIDGPGRVSGDLKGATYHAPAGKPRPNKATVAATITYSAGRNKTILQARITILEAVKVYEGTFSQQSVQVREDFKTSIAGTMRWTLDEVDEDSKSREYVGVGKAAFTNTRKGCGAPVSFTNVPVEGQLKVYANGQYEFRLSLNSDETRQRKCQRPDLDKKLKWDEDGISPSGEGIHSGDLCSRSDTMPRSVDPLQLNQVRSAKCDANLNHIQEGWSFKAVE